MSPSVFHDVPTATAGPSESSRHANPQLGPEPWFAYPEPTYEQLDAELPPYFDNENIPLGVVLDRLTLKGFADLGTLLQTTLPSSPLNRKPGHIIDFAKTQRQAFLKYLAILRWKSSVDAPIAAGSSVPAVAAAGFPTPQTNGGYAESATTSPAAGYIGKGKGKAGDGDDPNATMPRGKVTDAKRVAHFMEHQNRQHEDAIAHVVHITKINETLRERNPDLLTAIALLDSGTYNRLPTSLTEPFKPLPVLTNRAILRTLRRLNRHLLYRLRCVDHLPPELSVLDVRDGKVYLECRGEHGWQAQMTTVGFGNGDDDARWWLTGIEWGWRVRQRGSGSSPDELIKVPKLSDDERQQILDIVNNEVLAPKKVAQSNVVVEGAREKVDAPLVRLYNFLQHLSLSYQLETLFSQALEMSVGKWRGHLLVDLDRSTKVLRARYWVRQRPPHSAAQLPSAAKRTPGNLGAPRAPLIGGTITISLTEAQHHKGRIEDVMWSIQSVDTEPNGRAINLVLDVKWEVGEIGAGGGLKAGEMMDPDILAIDPAELSFQDILQTATRTHAAHLTRLLTTPLLTAPRLALVPLDPPSLVERDEEATPLSLRVPLPSRHKRTALMVSVSALSGLVEVVDEGGTETRAGRAKLASQAINEQRARLPEDLGRLVTAVVAENLETHMRQLGWQPTRRLGLRSQDLSKADLLPASSIFVPLPTSTLHYFTAKIGTGGLSFELLKLARVPADNGVGAKLAVGDRSPVDLVRLRARRAEREQGKKKEGLGVGGDALTSSASNFQIDQRDLKDLFLFCNALVAQTIVEQQLKDRSIPYTLQYSPTTGPGSAHSISAVAGMVPTICVNIRDFVKDPRATDVALPRVYIQLLDWWKGGRCETLTAVQLRHKPALASAASAGAGGRAGGIGIGTGTGTGTGAGAAAGKEEGTLFDANTSVVRFLSADITRSVPSFLEQWERLSKVIVIAGEVNRLNRVDGQNSLRLHAGAGAGASSMFKDLKMIAFDLRSATFSYAPGYSAEITYTPHDDSYRVSFRVDHGCRGHGHGDSPKAAARNGDHDMEQGEQHGTDDHATDTEEQEQEASTIVTHNPHEPLAGLLSHYLNLLASSPKGHFKGTTGCRFISLLCSTLPLLKQVEDSREASKGGEYPALVVRSVFAYRLVWDSHGSRYAVDVQLVGDRYLFYDGSTTDDPCCGPITPIPGWSDLLSKTVLVLCSDGADADAEEGKRRARTAALVLDNGQSLLCAVDRVRLAVKLLSEGVGSAVGT